MYANPEAQQAQLQMQHEEERLRALQVTASTAPPMPTKPVWHFHRIQRTISLAVSFLASWMFVTYLARLVPDLAIVWVVLFSAALITCFFVAIAGDPKIFPLVGIATILLIVASLLAGWDVLLGLFSNWLWKVGFVLGAFVLGAIILKVFFTKRPRQKARDHQSPSLNAYQQAWQNGSLSYDDNDDEDEVW